MRSFFVVDPSNKEISPPDSAEVLSVRLKYSVLERYCWRSLDNIDIDLMLLLFAVAKADRLSLRQRARGWSRTISINIPVVEIEKWRKEGPALCGVLRFLTGDIWDITFRERRSEDQRALSLPLGRGLRQPVVMSFSGGLDSFALFRTIQSWRKHDIVLLATRATSERHFSSLNSAERGSASLGVPFQLGVGEHAEPTFRSRTFVFFSLAALAAKLSNAADVLVAEPGPGALGPQLIPFADEHPYCGTSPLFTSKLSKVLGGLWGAEPVFRHPNLWKTKAEVLKELVSSGLGDGWELTISCSRASAGRGSGARTQPCGRCANCLYRRMSVYVAGLEERPETYMWAIDGNREKQTSNGSKFKRLMPSEIDVGAFGVAGMTDLANVSPDVVTSFARKLESVVDQGDTQAELCRMLRQHRAEWKSFLTSLPGNSWVRQLSEAMELPND